MTTQDTTAIPKKGTDIELSIESLAFGGMGVSRIGDMIVFVKNAIPGQTVLARITKKRASFLEARTLEIIEESSLAVDVKCEHFKDCGGCTFQNLDYAEQLAAKEVQVKDTFRRIGGFKDVTVEPILGCEEIFHYRNKMEFTFSNRRWLTEGESEDASADFALGLHVPGRYDKILNINECHIQSKDSNRILEILKEMTVDLKLAPYDIKAHTGFMRHLMIRHGGSTDEIMVNIVTSRDEHEKLQSIVDRLTEEFPNIVSIVNNITSRRAGVSTGDQQILLFGKDTINDKLGDYEYMISADSFFQTNTHQAKRLYDIIKEEAALTRDDVLYDLFCGTGSISIYLAKSAKIVYGFELVMSAVQDAIQNAHSNGIKNAWFFGGDLMNLFKTNIEAQQIELPDVMVVDPPRAGLHPNTINDIIEKAPKRLVYVSCNPSTQARDLKVLCENGFELTKLRPVDMFPHTPHVENVATLIFKDS
ncbi:MAG: 23S rRNA (uracil(1939)-C(5))-methyltransferase RlmD [Candidatus Marinimicrobia bacterium]|nr:23S rRNA (uracil(1939)-C(5))-methyltransferase RlmD [Candidatus Neomarinimicrobiota bacterium]|tara:strand:+ start:10163 stop:11590 length:1428 start_codon:yes stop_codon:yes gene_type:complete